MNEPSEPSDSRLQDQTVIRWMPYPIAQAWQSVRLASTDAVRVDAAFATVEVALRTLAAMQLAAYLAGAPVAAVEALLPKLQRPSLGSWLALNRELARASRDHEQGFVPEAAACLFNARGKPSPVLQRLEQLIQLRNEAAHGTASPSEHLAVERAAEVVPLVRQMMADLMWMARYRWFRVVAGRPTRRGTFAGRLQFFAGPQPMNEPMPAEWSARLLDGAIYCAAPAGDRVLELSPFAEVRAHPTAPLEALHLLAEVHRDQELVLACAAFDSTVRVRPEGERGPESWSDWLSHRAGRVPIQPNDDALGSLQGPARFDGAGATGQVLGERFELRGVLGTGGMSTVYRAHDRLHNTTVALKLLSDELTTDQELRLRFKREAQRMRALNHPNVLSDVELGELETGRLFLRMPVLEGGSLADAIAAGPIEPEQRERWARQLLSALGALEREGIVHRDIKPSNLMLDGDGNLLLVDFGIALGEADARLTRTLQQLGSLAYLAPEARGGHADHRSDLYSAALVLHEVCTGEAPRGVIGKGIEGTLGEVVRALGQHDPDLRPTASAALARLDGAAPLASTGTSTSVEPLVPGPDDVQVLLIGVLAGALGAVLWLGAGALGAFEADWASGLALFWLALALGLPGPVLAGLVLRTAPIRAAWAGAIGNLVAFGAGSCIAISGATQNVTTEALRVGDTAVPQVLTEAVLRPLVWAYGGLFVALTVGAGVAALVASLTRASRGSSPPPDHMVRVNSGISLALIALLLHVAVTAALGELLEQMLQVSPTVGTQLIAGGLGLLPTLLHGAFLVVAGWLLVGTERPYDKETFGEDATCLLAAVGLLLFGGLSPTLLGFLAPACAIPPLVLRLVRGWPHRREVPTLSPSDVGLRRAVGVGLAWVPMNAIGLLPMNTGLALGLLAVVDIPALQGLTDAQDPEQARHQLFLLIGTLEMILLVWVPLAVTGFAAALLLFRRWRRPSEGPLPPRGPLIAAVVVGLLACLITGPTVRMAFSEGGKTERPTTSAPDGMGSPWRGLLEAELSDVYAEATDPPRRQWLAAIADRLGERPPRPWTLPPGAEIWGSTERLDHQALHRLDDPVARLAHASLAADPRYAAEHDLAGWLGELEIEGTPLWWVLAMRHAQATQGPEAVDALVEQARESDAPRGLIGLEHARSRRTAGDLEGAAAALERALVPFRNRMDVRAARLELAILRNEAELERSLRDEVFGAEKNGATPSAQSTRQVIEAWLARGERAEVDRLLEELERKNWLDQDLLAELLDVERLPGLASEGWRAELLQAAERASEPDEDASEGTRLRLAEERARLEERAKAPLDAPPGCEAVLLGALVQAEQRGPNALADLETALGRGDCRHSSRLELMVALGHGWAALLADEDGSGAHLEALRARWTAPSGAIPLLERLRAAGRW